MGIGNKIYELRTNAKLSQSELAEVLDVSRQSVSKWETENSVPDLDKLIVISKYFKISLDELVNGEETTFEREKVVVHERMSSHKIIGYILFALGLLTTILFIGSAMMFVTGFIALTGLMLIVFNSKAYFIIGWSIWLLLTFTAPYYLGMHPFYFWLLPRIYGGMFSVMTIIVVVYWGLFIVMFVTSYRKIKTLRN